MKELPSVRPMVFCAKSAQLSERQGSRFFLLPFAGSEIDVAAEAQEHRGAGCVAIDDGVLCERGMASVNIVYTLFVVIEPAEGDAAGVEVPTISSIDSGPILDVETPSGHRGVADLQNGADVGGE